MAFFVEPPGKALGLEADFTQERTGNKTQLLVSGLDLEGPLTFVKLKEATSFNPHAC